MSLPSPSDQGVVLYLRGTAAGTYTDRNGTTRDIGALTTSYVASDEFQIGRAGQILVTLSAVLVTAPSVLWALQLQRADSSGVTWRWVTVQTERLDGGGFGSSGVQTALAAAFLEPDGSTRADVGYGSTSTRLSGKARLIAKAGGAPAATDLVIFAVDAS